MIRVFRSEFLKIRKSSIWLLIFVSPILSTLVGIAETSIDGVPQWLGSLMMMAMLHAMLFLPLLTGVFSAFVCRYEHIGGGWKQLLSMPVSRNSIFIVKFLTVMGLLVLTQILFLIGLLVVGQVKGYTEPIPWQELSTAILGGWIACMPLAALQIFVSIAWSSFAAPLAINVIFTIPNMLVANSEKFGPFYPWAQPVLMMVPHSGESFGAFNVTADTLFFVILGSFVVFFASGFTYFNRKEV
ncbi:ABC transporter permease [Fredinandcohnia humi]